MVRTPGRHRDELVLAPDPELTWHMIFTRRPTLSSCIATLLSSLRSAVNQLMEPAAPGYLSYSVKQPLGIVGIILPWKRQALPRRRQLAELRNVESRAQDGSFDFGTRAGFSTGLRRR
jgi:hypothetical protein